MSNNRVHTEFTGDASGAKKAAEEVSNAANKVKENAEKGGGEKGGIDFKAIARGAKDVQEAISGSVKGAASLLAEFNPISLAVAAVSFGVGLIADEFVRAAENAAALRRVSDEIAKSIGADEDKRTAERRSKGSAEQAEIEQVLLKEKRLREQVRDLKGVDNADRSEQYRRIEENKQAEIEAIQQKYRAKREDEAEEARASRYNADFKATQALADAALTEDQRARAPIERQKKRFEKDLKDARLDGEKEVAYAALRAAEDALETLKNTQEKKKAKEDAARAERERKEAASAQKIADDFEERFRTGVVKAFNDAFKQIQTQNLQLLTSQNEALVTSIDRLNETIAAMNGGGSGAYGGPETGFFQQ